MSTRALALLLLACAFYQSESSCVCPGSNPQCEGDGKCYQRSGGYYTWRSLSCGSCTASHMNSNDKLRDSDKGYANRCYSYFGTASAWCYTKEKDGTYANSNCASYNGYGLEWCCPSRYNCKAAPAPAPPPASSEKLKNSALGSVNRCYAYKGDTGKWCYTRKKDGSYASSNCASYDGYGTDWCCPNDYKCTVPAPANGGGCNPSPLGKFIANFAKSKNGVKVYSDLQRSATCWDLAYAALEQAKKSGLNPIMQNLQSPYIWSSYVVPVEQAQPGDIAQFAGWKEYKNGYSLYAWNPHTAVVTDCYKDGALTTYQQNPNPVAKGVYHPAYKTSGSVTIYRIKASSRLRLYAEVPQLSDLSHSGLLNVLAGVGALTGLLAFAFILKRRGDSLASQRASEDSTLDNRVALYVEADSESLQ